MSAATSKEQVNRSHQERDLTGLCLFCCVSLLGSGWACVVGGWVAALVLLLLGCGRSYLPVLGSVRSGWWFWRGLFWFPLVGVAVSGECSALCRAPLQWVGFRSARQALRFWWFRQGCFSVVFSGSVLPVLVL